MEGTPEKNCTNCKWFRSFEDIYEDDQEPNEVGWCFYQDECNYNDSPDQKDADIGLGYYCSKYEKR